MPRVIGTDPGTSSLDLLVLDDGEVVDQTRISPEHGRGGIVSIRAFLDANRRVDLLAAPSGYGLPLVRGESIDERLIDLMALTRPEESGRDLGVLGFRSWVRAILDSGIPSIFLPGGAHLPTIPSHRKANAIDMATPDKVAVAALAIHFDEGRSDAFGILEIGSAFTSFMTIQNGRLVDAHSGTRGPIGLKSSGVWDGETAYWLGPLSKADLFRGGYESLGADGPPALLESIRRCVAGAKSLIPFDKVYLSGAGLRIPGITELATAALNLMADVTQLPSLPAAWVKHAAQGAALIADGLVGGRHAAVVESLELRRASGTIWDGLRIRPFEGT